MNSRILYISYDGMLEPLGESQVLAYLLKLARDHTIFLISFEKVTDRRNAARMAAMRERLHTAGIAWTPLAYHKTPSVPATAFDITIGTIVAIWIALTHRVKIVHVRSYVPAPMALAVKSVTGAKFVFDMRGFWVDERVDGGLWPKDGPLYRITKMLERHFLKSADHIVTLTRASAREIARFEYLKYRVPDVTVIPTCADLDRFRPPASRNNGPFTLGYVGSVGTWYLFDEMLSFFRTLLVRLPDARLLIVNRMDHDFIRTAVVRAAIDPGCVEIIRAEHRDVAPLIQRMSAGTAIIKPAYSKIASAPTKVAEYLGCGVPCVGNVNVGDMEEILDGERVGVTLTDFSERDRALVAEKLLKLLEDPRLASRCVATARKLFALEDGAKAYRQIYDRIAGKQASADVPGTS